MSKAWVVAELPRKGSWRVDVGEDENGSQAERVK